MNGNKLLNKYSIEVEYSADIDIVTLYSWCYL